MSDQPRTTVDPIEVSTVNGRIRLKIDLAFGSPGFDYEPTAAVALACTILKAAGQGTAAALAASMFLSKPLEFSGTPGSRVENGGEQP